MTTLLLNDDVQYVSESRTQVSTKIQWTQSNSILSQFRMFKAIPKPWLPLRETIDRIKDLLQPHFHASGSVWPAPLDHQDDKPIQVTSDPVSVTSVQPGEDGDNSQGGSLRTFSSQIQQSRHHRRRRRRVCRAAYSNIEFLVLSLIHIVLIIPHICIGGRFLNDCPASSFVPVYLVTIGLLLSVHLLCNLLENYWPNRRDNTVWHNIWTVVNFTMCLTLDAVFISGCIVIFGLKTWSLDSRDSHYCHPVVYWFTKVTITGNLIIVLTTCTATAMWYFCADVHLSQV